MSDPKTLPVAGSYRDAMAGAKYVSAVGHADDLTVTLVLRPRSERSNPETTAWPVFENRIEFAAEQGASAGDMAAVEAFAHQHGLTVTETNEGARLVKLSGAASKMQTAFHVELGMYELPGHAAHYRCRKGEVSLPEDLHARVLAVLGLDNRPIAKPHMRRSKAAASTSFTPVQLTDLYSFPKDVTGAGQTIAIIELGGGYNTKDLNTYFSGLGMQTPSVTAVSVDGGKNTPGSDADGEVMLDIEVAGAIAPGAKIVAYFAPNTDQGFVDAISQAVHDITRKPSIISISWGASEDSWTDQARNAMNTAMQDAGTVGVTVLAAAGDDGSSDGATDGKLHVDFPAASPYALSCGGTKLQASGSAITAETVWNELASQEGATGGGVSKYFALPSYQASSGVPAHPETKFVGRGVPDVSGDADPTTGSDVLVNGEMQVIGGTSAVSPLWAGLLALINQQLGKPVGFINPLLYRIGSGSFQDVDQGDNGYYKAGKGWDACTGLGSPNGAALLKALQPQSGTTGTRASVAMAPGSSKS